MQASVAKKIIRLYKDWNLDSSTLRKCFYVTKRPLQIQHRFDHPPPRPFWNMSFKKTPITWTNEKGAKTYTNHSIAPENASKLSHNVPNCPRSPQSIPRSHQNVPKSSHSVPKSPPLHLNRQHMELRYVSSTLILYKELSSPIFPSFQSVRHQ